MRCFGCCGRQPSEPTAQEDGSTFLVQYLDFNLQKREIRQTMLDDGGGSIGFKVPNDAQKKPIVRWYALDSGAHGSVDINMGQTELSLRHGCFGRKKPAPGAKIGITYADGNGERAFAIVEASQNGTIPVPPGACDMYMYLNCEANGSEYDGIRICVPVNKDSKYVFWRV